MRKNPQNEMKFGSSTGLETILIVLALSKATLAKNDVAFHGLLRGGETPMMQRHLSSEQCSAGEELVRCEYGNRPCDGAGIANCDVYCHDACKAAKIDESDVECVQDRSCYQTTFRIELTPCCYCNKYPTHCVEILQHGACYRILSCRIRYPVGSFRC